jgi:TonB family protein
MGDLMRRQNNADKAEAYYGKAVTVLGDRPEAARALLYLAVMKMRSRKGSNTGEKGFQLAAELLRKAQSLDPTLGWQATLWTAVVREREQNWSEAEAMYKSALAMASPESGDAATAMEMYASLLRHRLDRPAEAKTLSEQAAAIRKELARKAKEQGVDTREAGPRIYRVGGGVTAPNLISKVEPQYSEEARIAKYSGSATVYAEIGVDGLAHNVRVLNGAPFGLDDRALDAINSWRFKPGAKDGNPVTVAATIEVNFRLL